MWMHLVCSTCSTRGIEEAWRLGVRRDFDEIIIEDRNRAVAMYGGRMLPNIYQMKQISVMSQVNWVKLG